MNRFNRVISRKTLKKRVGKTKTITIMKIKFLKPKMLITLTIIGILLAFTSCEKEKEIPAEESLQPIIDIKSDITEKAYPEKTGELIDVSLLGGTATVEDFGDHYIFEGDIILSQDDLNQKSTGRTKNFWPNCTVYYTVENSLPNKTRVYDAIAHWEKYSNLRFVKRTNQTAYVNFRKGSGCSSAVGRTGGKQNINLANGCSTGNTIHEIGHAIGLWHEQSRKDRNSYVTINFGNIQSGKSHNFKTYVQRGMDGTEYTSTLDFGSIMMYGPYAFSKNGKPTIIKKNGSTYSVQRNALSWSDRIGASKMYPYKPCGTQDCISFNPNNLRVVRNSLGTYSIADGSHYVFSAPNYTEANRIIYIVKRYGFTKSCYVKRPNASFKYQLVGNSASNVQPVVSEDIIRFDPNNIDVQKIGGRWKIVDGNHLIFDFGNSETQARKALCLILRYKFTGVGYVGRPGASLQYMVK